MLAAEFFTPARLQEMRDEICREGFIGDKILADNPDCPVFGVNLACLYPFPTEIGGFYNSLAEQLSAIDPGVYVYPIWETHVTIATFINFTRQISPSPERLVELNELMHQIASQLENVFEDIKPFELWIEPPVISRKAAILPLSDPVGAISEIRTRVANSLALNQSLRRTLDDLGLNIPPLVHSTIMRFKTIPANTHEFLSKFDEISRTVPRATTRVNEIYITTETKPYMRAGEILHRYQL